MVKYDCIAMIILLRCYYCSILFDLTLSLFSTRHIRFNWESSYQNRYLPWKGAYSRPWKSTYRPCTL